MPGPVKQILSHEGSQLSGTRGRKYFFLFHISPKDSKATFVINLTKLQFVSTKRDVYVGNLNVFPLWNSNIV